MASDASSEHGVELLGVLDLENPAKGDDRTSYGPALSLRPMRPAKKALQLKARQLHLEKARTTEALGFGAKPADVDFRSARSFLDALAPAVHEKGVHFCAGLRKGVRPAESLHGACPHLELVASAGRPVGGQGLARHRLPRDRRIGRRFGDSLGKVAKLLSRALGIAE